MFDIAVSPGNAPGARPSRIAPTSDRSVEPSSHLRRRTLEVEDLTTTEQADAVVDLVAQERELGAARLRLAVAWADRHLPECRQEGAPGPAPRFRCSCRTRAGDLLLVRPIRRCRFPGHDGTPAVSASGVAEFAVLLGTTTPAGSKVLGDALDLRHRHPRLWQRVMAGEVLAWQACRVAGLAGVLTLEQARRLDAETADVVGRLPWLRALSRIEAAIVAADPEGHEVRRREAEARRYVSAGRYRGTNSAGLRTLVAQTVAGDVARIDALVSHLADLLGTLGDEDTLDVRRATAFGLLAEPARVCMLLSVGHDARRQLEGAAAAECVAAPEGDAGECADPRPAAGPLDLPLETMVDGVMAGLPGNDDRDEPDEPTEPEQPEQPEEPEEPGQASAVQQAEAFGRLFRRLGREQGVDPWVLLRSPTSLVLHLSETGPVVRMADTAGELGPIGLGQLRDLLTDRLPEWLSELLADPGWLPGPLLPADDPPEPPPSDRPPRTVFGLRDGLVVRPVLHLDGQEPVDGYEVPARLREALEEASPYEVFPWGTADSRRCQPDHTAPYVFGDEGRPRPAAQTRLDNLGPLSVAHHNLKTREGWRCHQPLPGLYLWQTPSGHWFRVDHTGTVALGRERPAILQQLEDARRAGSVARPVASPMESLLRRVLLPAA